MSNERATPTSVDYSASQYNQTASFVYSPQFAAPVLSALNARAGERIVDFGCGSGELTLQIQEAVGGSGLVVGVDYNEDMIAKARENGVRTAFVFDLQSLEIPSAWLQEKSFDAIFSNAALHWCKRDPRAVLKSAQRLLKSGGRFVCEMGGFMNCIGVRVGLHRALKERGCNPDEFDPWYFPSIEEYRSLLESSGFRVDSISLNPRLTPLPDGGLHGWLCLFARGTFLRKFSDEDASNIINEVVQMCEVDCKNEKGEWAMMYVRLRFSATLG
ncbi:S-adenosyl-L-methionine-dependent methyltransferase [Leucogyrophana mollusca]|uniref:S-adenosyl-L-methionine-dependent methyltransferase n=1 Tax=Leucogyrophana mollusca TaxID=85980 RepID=A0ACB8BJW7_9AGAM|nr:S-adenosyl-L-methionine-dependent methyltransferase [Leucogyrophana mollusca]